MLSPDKSNEDEGEKRGQKMDVDQDSRSPSEKGFRGDEESRESDGDETKTTSVIKEAIVSTASPLEENNSNQSASSNTEVKDDSQSDTSFRSIEMSATFPAKMKQSSALQLPARLPSSVISGLDRNNVNSPGPR